MHAPTYCAAYQPDASPEAAAPPVEERLARPRTKLDRHGPDVCRLPGPQHREALPRGVRPKVAPGLELAEQQHVVQLPVHLHPPLQDPRSRARDFCGSRRLSPCSSNDFDGRGRRDAVTDGELRRRPRRSVGGRGCPACPTACRRRQAEPRCVPLLRTCTPGYTGAPPLSGATGAPPGETLRPGVTTIVVEGEVREDERRSIRGQAASRSWSRGRTTVADTGANATSASIRIPGYPTRPPRLSSTSGGPPGSAVNSAHCSAT